MTTPPMLSGGLAVVGHAVEMLRDREHLFKRGYAEHGDLFTITLGPQYAVVITGEEHNRQFCTQTDKSLNMQDGYGYLKEAIGEVRYHHKSLERLADAQPMEQAGLAGCPHIEGHLEAAQD